MDNGGAAEKRSGHRLHGGVPARTTPAGQREFRRRRTAVVMGHVDGAVAGGCVTARDGLRGPSTNQAPRRVSRSEELPRSSPTLPL